MKPSDERGEKYITQSTPVDGGEVAVEVAEGLDFPTKKSVNPEDLTEGGLPMDALTNPPSTRNIAPDLTSITVESRIVV